MKTLNARIVVVVISLLSLFISPAAKSFTGTPIDREDQWRVSNTTSFEDASWPIVGTEELTVKDLSTGEERIVTAVIRRTLPRKDQNACKDAQGNVTTKADKVAAAAATCVLGRTSLTIQGQNTVGGGVTGYVKVFANEYCSSGDCNYRKMTKIQVWWTRIGTGWKVRSAYMRWGCNGSCAVCPNNTPYITYQQSSTFTPTWNGLTSTTYTWTKSDWPIMKKTAGGDHFGYTRSVAESPSFTTYVLEVWMYLP